MGRKKRLVQGVGINDANYVVTTSEIVNGKLKQVWECPFYRSWKAMLRRCSDKYKEDNPRYLGCSISEEWLTFSNYRKWMIRQDWENKQLDKNLLLPDNKIYSAETCVFVDSQINTFNNNCTTSGEEHPVGFYWNKRQNKFHALCNNPFTKKSEHLGYFTCPNQAHEAWRKRKHELACQLADLQTDQRVAEALRIRYN